MRFPSAGTTLAACLMIVMSPLFGATVPGEPTAAPRAPPPGSAGGPSNQYPHVLDTADVAAWLQGLLDYGLNNGDIAGAEISIVKDGELLFEAGYGFADVAKKIRMDPERVLVRLGSTSKLFTWTAVMQLVEQQKIELNRNIDDYLDFKVSAVEGKPITMLDLMNHRGGFAEGLKNIFALDPQELLTTEEFLKRDPARVLFAPGSVPAYSNYGTALAGYIVQRVSGETFERYIDNHILEPLGMSHSTFEQPLPERYRDAMARGYRSASAPAQPFELVATAPAGSGTTTASDMARFMIAHLADGRLGDHHLMRVETAQLMHAPSELAPAGFSRMAHGFFYETRNGRTMIGHGGDTVFFHSELDLLPQEHVGIFYSFNSRGRDQAVYGLRKAILDQFVDRYFPQRDPAPEQSPLATAQSDARRIVGRYETSRRIEHGFLSFFYLLQQSTISANSDGTINVPRTLEPGPAQFQEVTPDVWKEVGGHREIALRQVNGVATILDSEDPTSVLQAVPMRRSSAINVDVLTGSIIILLSALVLWPILYWVRRHYQHVVPSLPGVRRHRLLLRGAAVLGLMWMIGWAIALQPVVTLDLDFYTSRHDAMIRALQIGSLILVAASAAAVWSFGNLWRKASWLSRLGNGSIAVAMLGLVWIGFNGGMMSLSLNY